MHEIDEGQKEFLDHWFRGFSQGLDGIDDVSRKKMLGACGKACAQSYTVQIFREARQASHTMEEFFRELSKRLPGARYMLVDEKTLRATYAECGCDLVRLGWVRSPALCECSAANLRENLEEALGREVSVEVESSILRGEKSCVLVARVDKDLAFNIHE